MTTVTTAEKEGPSGGSKKQLARGTEIGMPILFGFYPSLTPLRALPKRGSNVLVAQQRQLGTSLKAADRSAFATRGTDVHRFPIAMPLMLTRKIKPCLSSWAARDRRDGLTPRQIQPTHPPPP